MCAFKIFDPTTLPVEPADLQQHGIDDVKRLATHYGTSEILATPEECLSKWSSFKQFVKERGVNSHADMTQLLCTNSKLAQIYPNMTTMAQICRVIPVHSADVERTFLQLKLIKTAVQNRMIEQTLDALLRIVIEGPPIEEFPYKEAVSLWASKKNRRIKY